MNGRLYRSALRSSCSLPLLLLAFTITRAAPLARPILRRLVRHEPALALARDLAPVSEPRPGQRRRDRRGGLVRRAAADAALRPDDAVSKWSRTSPGLGRVPLRNIAVVVPGPQSPDAIVVMAHRDDAGDGPGGERQRERDRRADRARPRVRPARRRRRAAVTSAAHDRLPLDRRRRPTAASAPRTSSQTSPYGSHRRRRSTSTRSAGAARRHRIARRHAAVARTRRLVATASRGRGADRRVAAARRLLRPAGRSRVPVHALRAGAVRRRRDSRGHDHDRRRPAAAGVRRHAAGLERPRLGQLGARRRSSCSGRSTGPRAGAGHRRATSGSAAASSAAGRSSSSSIALLAPVRGRGRRSLRPLPPACGSRCGRRAARCATGCSSGSSSDGVFTCFRLLGAWPSGAARPPNPGTPVAGDWP